MAKETKVNKIIFAKDIQKVANLAFGKVVGVGILLFIIVGFLAFRLYLRLQPFIMALIGKLEMICGCQNHLVFSNHPYIFTSLITGGALLTGLFLYVAYRVFKLKRNTSKFIKDNLENIKTEHSSKLDSVLKELSLSDRVILINDEEMEVFCYGFLKPKICISTKIVDTMERQELKSILLHEKYHLLVGEPIRLFFTGVLSRALFFIPGYKRASDRYTVLSELAADSYAGYELNSKIPLATALYKVISHKKDNIENQLAVSGFQTVTEDRISGLSDGLDSIKLNIISPTLILGLVLFFTFSLAFNAIALSDSKTMSHASGQCVASMPINDTECQMDEAVINEYNLEHCPTYGVCEIA